MKTKLLISGVIVNVLLASCSNKEETVAEFKNENDSLSYSVGLFMGKNLKNNGFDSLNTAAFAVAFKSVLKGDTTYQITMEKAEEIIGKFSEKKQEELQKKQIEKGKVNLEEGDKFLAENAKKAGVTVLPSGLQYEILVKGTGPKPKATSTVKTHYHGVLLNGVIFDSSYQRGEPAIFGINQVIPGWTEALQLMTVGSKWKLYIPYNLAYGERGAGESIPPYSTLVFEVELLGIEK